MEKNKLIYLATPYSKFLGGREQAYHLACKMTMELMDKGMFVFSPIAHSHSIEEEARTIRDGDWWLAQDFEILKRCDELVVYKLPGWDQSYGVKHEIAFANSCGIPISYMDMENNNEEQLELFD